MSLQKRQEVVDRLFFQDEGSKSDLLDPNLTNTNLIAMLDHLHVMGFFMEVTAVRSDHHPDGYLGKHSHQAGNAIDLWPLKNREAGNYLDENSRDFQLFLHYAQADNLCFQVGLGGSANNAHNVAILGPKGFIDNGSDHVHLGCVI